MADSTINLKKLTISLAKGQKINLTKEAPGLHKVMVGLGWKANSGETVTEVVKPGFLGRLFGAQERTETRRVPSGHDYDLDAAALMLRNGHMTSDKDLVYYGHRDNGSIHHCGDNLVGGEGSLDDEEINIDLDKVPESCDYIKLFVVIYQAKYRNQNFAKVKNMFIRLVNSDDGHEICRYADESICNTYGDKVCLHFGDLHKVNGTWEFEAVGVGTDDGTIGDFARRFR